MTVEGTIPQACFGTLYRNGPTLYERAGERYQHWFDPDGMIQAFRLGPDGASHEGRFVRTRKYEREQAEGRFLFNGAGTQVANPAPPRSNQDFNVANINIQPHNGELLALWEAGSAYRIDPETLDTRGIQAWHDELEGVPFSAHPRFDERGDMWNIGSVPFAGTPTLVLYHVNATGNMVKYRAHTLDFSGYMHDFVLTPRYLIALNSSAVHDGKINTTKSVYTYESCSQKSIGNPGRILIPSHKNEASTDHHQGKTRAYNAVWEPPVGQQACEHSKYRSKPKGNRGNSGGFDLAQF